MGKHEKPLKDLVKELPPDVQAEVRRFLSFLLTKMGKRRRAAPTLGWAGALKDLKGRYTSVELQHKISEWRIGGK